MKLKIQVKLINGQQPLNIIDKGDCIDLHSNIECTYSAKDISKLIYLPLGVAMKLPKGMIAKVYPRSSSPKRYGFIVPNSLGIIDQTYCGNEDEWMLPILPFKEGKVEWGDRVCQFEICLSQKATIWQKIKWLLSSGIKIEYVDKLEKTNRGGFGSTGK